MTGTPEIASGPGSPDAASESAEWLPRSPETAGADGFSDDDRRAMARALELAARGLNTTHPNPRVGCVISRGGRIIGEGWHERAGEAHAEVVALRAVRDGAAGATAYVTLEPCSHHGRTPPCADALIEAGVSRVVFAMQDPDPRVSGRGAERLRRAGIRVESGLYQREAAELNAGYVLRMTAGRPWVRVKLAASLDGRTALASGASRWITGEEARADVQHWRARSSAVLTGIGTVLADDPRLDVRLPGEGLRQPIRVVLDSGLRTPPGARLFSVSGEVWIFTSSQDAERRRALEARGARVERIERIARRAEHTGQRAEQAKRLERADRAAVCDGDDQLDLRAVMKALADAQINEVHVEAGATLAGELIHERLVDEVLLYMAPVLLGPQARPLVDLPMLEDLSMASRFDLIETQQIGADLRIRLRPRHEAGSDRGAG
jgi:diaminohydroxyphosphoribosylaminopyrimidine deaminase / 5-amino-6-(5-phosphoribosylamino)uracil reductase